MNFFKRALPYIKNPRLIYVRSATKNLRENGKELSDEEYLKRMFKVKLGYKLDLDNPRTFNEKMQYLKLYNRKPIYTDMVDKYAAKEYVRKLVGDQYIAKPLGCWDKPDQIDYDSLPNKFVLKATHGCGGMLFLNKEEGIDPKAICDFFNGALNLNYYLTCREWPYKDVKPRIIAEEFLKDSSFDVLPVYKFFCFSGEPFIAQVIQNDKHENETIDYIDMDWNFLKLKQDFPNTPKKKRIEKPAVFEEMKQLCRLLTKDIPFVRCDLYVVNNKVYFSEFTFFSDAGFEKFHPKKWDKILGDKIDLSNVVRR